MEKTKTYKVGNDIFDIPENEEAQFLKDVQGAVEVQSFVVGKDTFDIPLNEVSQFQIDVPNAKPLKKKDESVSEAPSISPTRLTAPLTVGQEPDKMKGLLVEKPASIFNGDKYGDIEFGLSKQSKIDAKRKATEDAFGMTGTTANDIMQGFANGVASLPDQVLKGVDFLWSLSPAGMQKRQFEQYKGLPRSKSLIDEVRDTPQYQLYLQGLKEHSDALHADDVTIRESLKNKDYGKALKTASVNMSQSLPLTLSALFGGPVGLAAVGVAAGGEQYDSIKDEDMPEANKLLNSAMYMYSEILTESVTQSYGKMLKGVFAREGKKEGTKLVAKGLNNWMYGGLKKLGLYTAPVGEGLSEGMNGAAQYLSDVAFGIEEFDNEKLKDVIVDNMVVGGLMGSGFTLVGASGSGLRKLSDVTQENAEIKSSLKDKVNAPDKDSYLDGILKDVPETYKPDTRKDITELLIKKDELQTKLDKSSEKLKPVYEKQIKEIDNKLNEVIGIAEGLIEPETQIEKPTAPKTKKPTKPLAKEENVVEAPKTINTEVAPKGAEITPSPVSESNTPTGIKTPESSPIIPEEVQVAESTAKGGVVQNITPGQKIKVGELTLEGEAAEEYLGFVEKYGKEKADDMMGVADTQHNFLDKADFIKETKGKESKIEPGTYVYDNPLEEGTKIIVKAKSKDEANTLAYQQYKDTREQQYAESLKPPDNAQEITPPVSPSSPAEVRNVGEQTGEEVYMGDTEKVREETPQAQEVTLESARSIEELDDLVRAGKITAVNPVYLQKKYDAGKKGWYEKSDVPDEARTMPLSANVTISGKTYTDETQLKVALQNKEISKGDYSSAKASLSKQKFDQAKERLRNSIEGMVTKQAIGDESASLGEVFDSLVEFIKCALDMYGDKIRSARDVAKYTGVAYNKTLQDAYDEAMGKNDVPRERKMRGFPKRIKDFEEFKNIKIDLEQNEELKYTPQSLDDIKDRLSTMNNEELVERVDELTNMRLVDGDDNLAVYAGIELINRYKAEGSDVMPIVERLGRAGTAMGQLIRQYAELKGSTGEGMLSVLEKQLEQQNRYLTPEQKEEFTSLANADIQARAKLKDQAGLTKIDFSKENIAEYDRLKKEAETAYTKMAKYMQSIVPKKFWDMMGMALQGNLLTPMSQITNIYANLMNIPLTASSRVLISPVDAITTGVFGTERVTRLDPKIIVEALKGFGYGVKEAFKQIKTGVDYGKVEQTRGFQPLRALGQAFSNKNMPVNKQGKVEWTDRVNKVVEGLVGLPPETMFRLLNLGDKPFYRMSERVSLYRQGKALGLKGDALEGFIMFPSIKSQKQATKEAQEATFQEESTTAKAAVKATQSIFNMLHGTVLEGPWKFLMRTQMPYVKTPANILSQALDYAVPPLSLGKGLYQMSKGNKQDGLVNIGKAGVGVMMGMAAKVLLDNGLMTGSGDDEKERNLQYDVIPPNSVNLSGIQRMVQGGNPEPQNGDRVINLNKMGITGMVMGIHANVYSARKEMSGKDKELTDNAIKTISTLIEVPAYVLEQSFMRGTSTLISAISDRQWNYWLTNTFNAVSSIPIPNTLSALNRASWEYIPELKGNDLGERLSNVIKAKTFRTEDLPLKINLWGEPIKQTPVGRNAWMYQLLDVTKSQDIQLKPESKFIYDLYNKTQDSRVIPSMPKRKLTINSKQVELDSKDYERFLILVGQARYNQLRNFVGSKAASSMTDEQAVDYIDRLYGIGRDYGKNMFLYEMRLSGRKIE